MEPSGSNPTLKDIVELLMSKEPELLRDVKSKTGVVLRTRVAHCVYSCPKKEDCKTGGKFIFEKGTGFTNPYKQLKSCLSHGDESHLLNAYYTLLSKKKEKYGDVFSSLC